MRFEQLDASTLEQLGNAEVQSTARALLQNQQVQHGYHHPNCLQGVIWDEEEMLVEIRIQDGQVSFICPCIQIEEEGICPHCLALLWAWVEKREKFLHRGELKERLKKYSRKDLVELILDLADRIPEIRDALREEDQSLEEILESIDSIMDEVADEGKLFFEAEAKLQRAQAWADRLAQTGQLAEARAIYFYLLDKMLGVEETLPGKQLFAKELKEELFEEYCQLIHEDRQIERDLVQQELEQLANREAVTRGELDLSEVQGEIA